MVVGWRRHGAGCASPPHASVLVWLCVFAIAQVDVAFTTTVTDRLLTGVQFSQRDPKSSDVMVAAYDSHSVSVWISA